MSGSDEIADLVAVGEAMAELRRDRGGDWQVGFAGDTFNTAYYCALSLGEGGRVAFHSRVGEDPLSASFLEFADARRVATSTTECDRDRNIGIYSVSTDAAGERSFHYWRSQSAARQMFAHDEDVGMIPAARIVFLSAITLAILEPAARQRLKARLLEMRARGSLIAFDSNFRPRLWENPDAARRSVAELWEIADIALPTAEDEMALFGDKDEAAVLSRFSARSWVACALKRGERGPVSPTISSADMPRFAPAAKVVDTTAAGDSFNGAYLASLLQGKPESECLAAGHSLAAKVVGRPGAIVDLAQAG